MSNEIVTYEKQIGALTVDDVQRQVNLIQHVRDKIMQKDQHYGVIPGTGDKPTLLKAGAEKLCLTFRLDPQYEVTQTFEGQHLTVMSKCTLWHIPSGQRFGSGMGSCSTKESKYAYRKGTRKCPHCGAEAIIKGKDFKGDGKPTGWICFAKKGGCGAKFADGDPTIEKQDTGRVPNEDLPDQYNTVLKMANKRSLVAAVLNTTAASDFFTQDVEDLPTREPEQQQEPGFQGESAKAAPKTRQNRRERDMGAAQVVETDPDDEGLKEVEQRSSEPVDKSGLINADQATSLRDRCSEVGVTEAAFCKMAKIAKIEELAAARYDGALEWLDKQEAK